MADALAKFFRLQKVDAAQRIVVGVIAEETPDRTNEIMDYLTAKPAFEKWSGEQAKASDGKNFGNIRLMHGKVAAGLFEKIEFNDTGKQVIGHAKIVDDDAWKLVESGVLTGFSVGGGYAKRWNDPSDPKLKRYTPDVQECSLVDRPCMPGATFEFVKSDGSCELRKFVSVEGQDPNGPTNARDGVVQAWVDKAGNNHETRAQALAANASLEIKEAADKAAGMATEALNKLAAAIDRREHPVDLDRAGMLKFALGWKEGDVVPSEAQKGFIALQKLDQTDPAAKISQGLKEGDQFDPAIRLLAELAKREAAEKEPPSEIKTKDDLLKAVTAFGDKNQPLAKAILLRQAKALGAIDDLPASWKGETAEKAILAGALKKGMYEVGRLASLINELNWLQESVESEDKSETMYQGRAPSALPASLKEDIANLCATLRSMVEEETNELFDEKEMEALGPILTETVEVVILEAAAGAVKHDAFGPMLKMYGERVKLEKNDKSALAGFVTLLEKIGAKHSDSTKKKIKTIHDTVSEMDPDCCKAGTAKSASGDLEKLTAVNSELEKRFNEMAALIEPLTKRVDEMANQPVTAKGKVTVFSREHGAAAPSQEDLAKQFSEELEKLPENERALVLMKVAQGNPKVIRG